MWPASIKLACDSTQMGWYRQLTFSSEGLNPEGHDFMSSNSLPSRTPDFPLVLTRRGEFVNPRSLPWFGVQRPVRTSTPLSRVQMYGTLSVLGSDNQLLAHGR
jgi:hypothetical protein